MTDTMIARIAQALQPIARAGDADLTEEARKLLHLLREPAAGMAEAGAEVVPGEDPAIHAEVATDVWRAMIDEALNQDFALHPGMPEAEREPHPGHRYEDPDAPYPL